jgi:hypothetical protein
MLAHAAPPAPCWQQIFLTLTGASWGIIAASVALRIKGRSTLLLLLPLCWLLLQQ